MEHALTRTAAENDADFLARVARSWTDAIDQDGAEPSEELLRQLQGAFIRRRRHGLHHVEIFATTEQFEHLLTVMNTGTNPRTGTTATAPATDAALLPREDSAAGTATGWGSAAGESLGHRMGLRRWHGHRVEFRPASARVPRASRPPAGVRPPADESAAGGCLRLGFRVAGTASNDVAAGGAAGGVSACDSRPAVSTVADVPAAPASEDQPLSREITPSRRTQPASADHAVPVDDPGAGGLDLRSRPQRLLDGLVGACKLALATGQLPAAGGLRPQVMVTIDYRDLLTRLGTHPADMAGAAGGPDPHGPQRPGRCSGPGRWSRRGRCCSPGPSRPRPCGRSPATPTSSRSCSAARAGSWTSAGPPGSSRRTSARPSSPATGAAPSPAAPSRPPGAKPTTSPTGPAAAPPEPRTGPCSAPITTT